MKMLPLYHKRNSFPVLPTITFLIFLIIVIILTKKIMEVEYLEQGIYHLDHPVGIMRPVYPDCSGRCPYVSIGIFNKMEYDHDSLYKIMIRKYLSEN